MTKLKPMNKNVLASLGFANQAAFDRQMITDVLIDWERLGKEPAKRKRAKLLEEMALLSLYAHTKPVRNWAGTLLDLMQGA